MKKKVIILLLIFINLNRNIYTYINIYPIKFDKDISRDVSEEFFLYNRTKENKKYRIYLENNENNEFNNLIEIYPKSILLKPLEEKSFKVYIKASKEFSEGVYSTNLIVKEIEDIKIKQNKTRVFTKLKIKLIGRLEKKHEKI